MARPEPASSPWALSEDPVPAPGHPLRLHPEQVDRMRDRLHAVRLHMNDPILERFVKQVFADYLMVESYYLPRFVAKFPEPPSLASPKVRQLLPIEEAVRVAEQASRSQVLLPFERQLAFVAALVQPCGLFHCIHPHVRATTGLSDLDRRRTRGVSYHLLAQPLHHMRVRHRGMADTFSAVLGFGDDGHCDPDQVSRIGAAMVIPAVRIHELWTGPEF